MKRNFIKIYLGIVSSILFIATCVSFGILASAIAKKVIISNEEYINGHYNRGLKECLETEYLPNGIVKNKSDEEIKKCEKSFKRQIISERNFNFKIKVISSVIWFFLFLVLFFVHYNKFKKR